MRAGSAEAAAAAVAGVPGFSVRYDPGVGVPVLVSIDFVAAAIAGWKQTRASPAPGAPLSTRPLGTWVAGGARRP